MFLCRWHGDGATRRVWEAGSQDLNAILSDEKRVLKLSRQRSVLGGTGPIVRPGAVTVCTNVNHGLNCEAHSRLCGADGLVLGVVRNIRCAVEELVDSVATIRLYNGAVAGLGVLLNRVSRVAEKHTRLDQVDGLVQTFTCGFHHAHSIGVRERLVSNIVGLVDITVESLVVQSDINVDNIAILQGSLVGDTVADGLVDGGADGLGEVHVVQGRGVRLGDVVSRRV